MDPVTGTIAIICFAVIGLGIVAGIWLSISGMIYLDRVLFTSLLQSPLLSWAIAGATIGAVTAILLIARRSNRKKTVICIAVIFVAVFMAVSIFNWLRTEHLTATVKKMKPVSGKTNSTTHENNLQDKDRRSFVNFDAVVISETAKIRDEASSSGNVKFSLEKDDEVHVTGKIGNWYRIQISDEGEILEGWIHQKLLSKKEN